MPVLVASRRRTRLSLDFPDALILDVTSRGAEPWIRLSPFYPDGGIPVPGHPGRTSQSVEGIWQALKVFATEPEDFTKLEHHHDEGDQADGPRLGPPLGHRLDGRLLGYEQARRLIYLPAYRWMLDHRAAGLLARLRELASHQTVILLDYTTNGDITDLSAPLSHAALITWRIQTPTQAGPVHAGDR
jgi:hypothetical protein